MYICSICNLFGGNTFGAVLRHIGEIHRYDPGLTIHCGINYCPQTYNNYESFRSHVYRKHRDALVASASAPSVTNSDSNEESDCEALNYDVNGDDDDSNPVFCYKRPDLQHNGAKFILKVREQYRLPQSTLESIISDIKGLWVMSIDAMKEKLASSVELFMEKLPDSSVVDTNQIMACFEDAFPLDGLGSEYKQLQYYKEHFNYLEPTERVLGRKFLEKNGRSEEHVDCCYDISLIDSLQQLLKMESVQEQIHNSHAQSGGLLGDYCDGELFSENALFKEDPCALQIQLYYDELEVCNPLGSKAKKHKLGTLYYTLGNLDPKLRSSLKSIHLLSVAKHEIISEYGIEELLRPVVDEVSKLESAEGVEFEVDGEVFSCRGTVTVFSADNLAAWAVGGYKALGSAFRKCQYCMVTDSKMQVEFKEKNLKLRTKEVYEAHVSDLSGPLYDHISTTYGMVRDSIMNELKYFHIVTGLVPDIMHNILEGTLELCMRQLLMQCINVDKLFTVKFLNNRIGSFDYGPDVANKPTKINPIHLTPTGHIKQTATQMWCLGRFLPLLIGDKIADDNPYWENFINHLQIIAEVFAPVTTDERLDYLTMLIEDFLQDFTALYKRPLTPKMHYLVHLPTWIKWCGPMIRLWCMRYEAKHSYFKHLSTVLRNFRNIPKTLAARHQHYMCYQMLDCSKYLRHNDTCTGVSEVIVNDLEYSQELLKAFPLLTNSDSLWRVRSVTIDGTTYKHKHVVVCSVVNEEPTFGKIVNILRTKFEETLFVMIKLHTIGFDTHYHAYNVLSTGKFIVYSQKELSDYHPLPFCKSFSTHYLVPLKYRVHSQA